MTKRVYSRAYFEQRAKLARATDVILEAMGRVIEQEGELTTIEWIKIFSDQVAKMVQYEMSEEGEETRE